MPILVVGNESQELVFGPASLGDVDLAIGQDGNPIIVFSFNGQLLVAKCNDPECAGNDQTITSLFDLGNQGILYLSVAIGVDTFPVISFYDAPEQALKLVKCNDQACAGNNEAIISIDDPDHDVGWATSIAIGSDGFPVISYRDALNDALKVAKCGDIACAPDLLTLSTVDDDGEQLALQTSIAIGIDGNPVISYQNSSDYSLKFAKCNDKSCTGSDELVQTLDIGARHTSITIGGDGLPIIAYCNSIANNFALKVIHCGTAHCSPSK